MLAQAVGLGIVKVTKKRGGFVVRGVGGDLLIIAELEAAGATYNLKTAEWFITDDSERTNEFRTLNKKTSAAAKALAARQALASKQGLKLFDNQRARQQKKITREIKDIYRQAMLEHERQIKRIKELLEQDRPADIDPKEWAGIVARRKNTLAELNGVYDELAAGLANAGANAHKLMNAQLQESAAISRNIAAWQIDNMSGVRVSRMIAHGQAALAMTGVTSYHGRYDLKAWQGVANKAQARKTIKNAISRGLLTGEHPEKIAKRIEGLFTGDEPLSPHKRAVRIARTETTRVMSEASLETMRAAQDEGVAMRKRWDATLDGRTRDSHRKVDGEVVGVDEKFSNGLRCPGDGGPADSINCRCALAPVVEGFEPEADLRRDNETGELIPYMTYEQWEKMRHQQQINR